MSNPGLMRIWKRPTRMYSASSITPAGGSAQAAAAQGAVAAGDPSAGPGGSLPREDPGRSARKRRAIMEAATTLFLRNGYQGTSMDDIAAAAAVSKQTVYKNFGDKGRLFT